MPTINSVWSDNELASIRNVDRLLPSQPYHQKMYKGVDFYGDMEKLMFSILPDCGTMKLDIKTKDGMTYAVMGTEINTLKFYQFLIRSNRYKQVLELGTYIGVSAMYLANAVKENDGNVTTIELGLEFYQIACENFEKNGMKDYILAYHNDCVSYLTAIRKNYDFILIDAAKQDYWKILPLAMARLYKGGMILVDDVFFQGDTLNAIPISEKGTGVKRMLDYVATLDGYEKVILPIGNGLLMIRKISS